MKTEVSIIKERFERKFEIDAAGCWVWTAATNGKGYGAQRIDGRNRMATHVSIYLHTGAWPDEHLEPDHLCFNTLCVSDQLTLSWSLTQRTCSGDGLLPGGRVGLI